MIRISLSSLAVAASLIAGAVTPAASETLRNTSQPTSCDCSNCSAEHCQGSSYSAIAFVGGWGASAVPAGSGFTTQQGGTNAGTESLHYRITLTKGE